MSTTTKDTSKITEWINELIVLQNKNTQSREVVNALHEAMLRLARVRELLCKRG